MLKILLKLHAIMSEVDYIQKDKKNTFFNYTYASEKAIKEALHGLLVKHKVLFAVSVTGLRREVYTTKEEKRGSITDVDMVYRFYDVESGECLEGPFIGTGDDGADKGTYKAITGAIKYILTSTFLIPTGDDAEADGAEGAKPVATQPKAVQQATQHVAVAPGDWQSFMLTFGKHKGKTLGEADPSYLSWLRGTEIKNPALASALAGWSAAQNPSQELPTIKVEEREREEWKPPADSDEVRLEDIPFN